MTGPEPLDVREVHHRVNGSVVGPPVNWGRAVLLTEANMAEVAAWVGHRSFVTRDADTGALRLAIVNAYAYGKGSRTEVGPGVWVVEAVRGFYYAVTADVLARDYLIRD